MPDLLFDNLPTIPTFESGLSHWLVTFSDLKKPVQVSFAPPITGQAVEGKCVIVTLKLFYCPHADHGQSIAICIQNVCLKLALDFYFFGGFTDRRAVIVYVRFRALAVVQIAMNPLLFTAANGRA